MYFCGTFKWGHISQPLFLFFPNPPPLSLCLPNHRHLQSKMSYNEMCVFTVTGCLQDPTVHNTGTHKAVCDTVKWVHCSKANLMLSEYFTVQLQYKQVQQFELSDICFHLQLANGNMPDFYTQHTDKIIITSPVNINSNKSVNILKKTVKCWIKTTANTRRNSVEQWIV